jgi:murein DD-endopeptidase MepM/ murein hydrolase activator NlpD
MFLMYPDATDKTSNKMEVQTNGSTSKDILVKKQEVGRNENQKSNPLANLSVYSTSNNPVIGKFGCTRNGGTGCFYSIATGNKNHHGLDLLAVVGTPVKSIYNGRIVDVKGEGFKPRNQKYINQLYDVDGQKLKGINGCHYAKDSYGKQLIVEYFVPQGIKGIDGKTITKFYVMYGHLDSIVKTSGEVKTGEKIGECGCSGNAASLPEVEHHVHIEASTSSSDFVPGIKRKINIENLIFNQK